MSGTSSRDLDDDLLGEEPGQERLGVPVEPRRLIESVTAGWKWIPLGTLAGAVLGVVLALTLIQHSYKSETVLVWEPVASQAVQRDLATQAGILKLPSTLEKVRQRMKWKRTVEAISKQIKVWYNVDSNLVTVSAGAVTAEEAVKLADTVAQVFVDDQRALARTRAQDLVDALMGDIEQARRAAAKIRGRYDVFRASNNIGADFTKESSAAFTTLKELKAQKDSTESEQAVLGARIMELEAQSKGHARTRVTSAASSSPVATRIASAQTELAAARARLAPGHPKLLALEAELSALQAAAPMQENVVGSVVTAPDPQFEALRSTLSSNTVQRAASEQLAVSYATLIERAEARVNELARLEGEARGLESEIAIAEGRIDAFEPQLAAARDAARNPPSEFRVLTPAVMPRWPQESKRRALAIGATVLGFLGALFFLLARPLWKGRMYTAREAAFWAHLPVIGSSSWPNRADRLRAFIDELNDHAALSRGATLVVGAGPEDAATIRIVASQLGPVQPPSRLLPADAATPRDGVIEAEIEGPGWTASHVEPPSGASAGGRHPDRGGADYPLLALDGATVVARIQDQLPVFLPWSGQVDGQSLRRAARMADRVLVVVHSGRENVAALAKIRTRLGRDAGVALAVVGVPDGLLELPDRVGDADAFWGTPLRSASDL